MSIGLRPGAPTGYSNASDVGTEPASRPQRPAGTGLVRARDMQIVLQYRITGPPCPTRGLRQAELGPWRSSCAGAGQRHATVSTRPIQMRTLHIDPIDPIDSTATRRLGYRTVLAWSGKVTGFRTGLWPQPCNGLHASSPSQQLDTATRTICGSRVQTLGMVWVKVT